MNSFIDRLNRSDENNHFFKEKKKAKKEKPILVDRLMFETTNLSKRRRTQEEETLIPDGSSKRHRWLMFRKIDPTVRRLASCDDDDVEREHEDANDDDDDERERERKKGSFPSLYSFPTWRSSSSRWSRWSLASCRSDILYDIQYILYLATWTGWSSDTRFSLYPWSRFAFN